MTSFIENIKEQLPGEENGQVEEHPVGVPKRPNRAEHHAVVDMSLLSATDLTAQKKDIWQVDSVKIGIKKKCEIEKNENVQVILSSPFSEEFE